MQIFIASSIIEPRRSLDLLPLVPANRLTIFTSLESANAQAAAYVADVHAALTRLTAHSGMPGAFDIPPLTDDWHADVKAVQRAIAIIDSGAGDDDEIDRLDEESITRLSGVEIMVERQEIADGRQPAEPPVAEFDARIRDGLAVAERFMRGFEGNEMQEGIDEQLAAVRAALELAGEGRPAGYIPVVLGFASAAIGQLCDQIEQMKGMFPGDDTIGEALENAGDTEVMIEEAIARCGKPAASRVVVSVSGGQVQGAVADGEIAVTVVDYDTDGETEGLVDVPQDNGTVEEARVWDEEPEIDGAWLRGLAAARIEDAGDNPECGTCQAAEGVEAETWQQWQCACCGSWNDKAAPAAPAGEGA